MLTCTQETLWFGSASLFFQFVLLLLLFNLCPSPCVIVFEGKTPVTLVILDCELVSKLRKTDYVNFFDLFRAVIEGRGKGW